MGVCFDCLVVVDGVPNTRACVTWVREGMVVSRQDGLVAVVARSIARLDERDVVAVRLGEVGVAPLAGADVDASAARRALRRPTPASCAAAASMLPTLIREVHRAEMPPLAAAVVARRVEHDRLDRRALRGHRHRHVLRGQAAGSYHGASYHGAIGSKNSTDSNSSSREARAARRTRASAPCR